MNWFIIIVSIIILSIITITILAIIKNKNASTNPISSSSTIVPDVSSASGPVTLLEPSKNQPGTGPTGPTNVPSATVPSSPGSIVAGPTGISGASGVSGVSGPTGISGPPGPPNIHQFSNEYTFKHISVDNYSTAAAAISPDNGVWVTSDITAKVPVWIRVAGTLNKISISNGQLFGSTASNDLFYAANYLNPQWGDPLVGQLKNVSLDAPPGKTPYICGSNVRNDVYCATNLLQPVWAQKSSNISDLSIANGKMLAVNPSGDIFYYPDNTSTNNIKLPGNLKQVSLNSNNMACGINTDNTIYCTRDASNPDWRNPKPNKDRLAQIAINNMQAYGTSTDFKSYRFR